MRIKKGFSLAEIVITVTLLGIVMMLLFNLFPGSIGGIKHAQHSLEANTFAQSMLEERREASFADLVNTVNLTATSDDGTEYTGQCVPFSVMGTDTDITQAVRVTVTWKERDKDYSIDKELYVTKVR